MTHLSYLLRKYPVARLAFLTLVIVLGISLPFFFTHQVERKPIITSISPNVAAPGSVLVIRGENFGATKSSGYVELFGIQLTERNYVSWTNNEIKVIIPETLNGGLVYVITLGGKSNPEFFANELAIPVSVSQTLMNSIPSISSISPENPYIGQVIVISGKNFGSARENSNVYFSARKETSATEGIGDFNSMGKSDASEKAYTKLGSEYDGFIAPSDDDYDYEYWSETEIRVRVPDGAESGFVFVAANNNTSMSEPLKIRRRGGEKIFPAKHTYLIQVEAELSKIMGTRNAAVTLHLPRPAVYSLQPLVNLTESVPEPVLLNYRNNSIFQVFLDESTNSKRYSNIKQNFVIECYSTETQLNRKQIGTFEERDRMLYRAYTRADEIIPSDYDEIQRILPEIIYNIRNPYTRAEEIFYYIIRNFKLIEGIRMSDADATTMLRTRRGDVYDFAVIYTAFLRAAGIPARMISGILINANKRTQNHWWTEFYIEDFGWIPVDIALAAGLEFDFFHNERHPSSYYFGNLDAQHAAFSLNYNIVKQSISNDKAVQIPRSYALQSVWEESSSQIESYSSYWPTPVVLGIY